MCRILYRFLALLARLAVRSGRSKDLEVIVLRHQLGVTVATIDRSWPTRTGPCWVLSRRPCPDRSELVGSSRQSEPHRVSRSLRNTR